MAGVFYYLYALLSAGAGPEHKSIGNMNDTLPIELLKIDGLICFLHIFLVYL